MKRTVVGWIVAIVLAVGGAAFAWVWFAGGSGEPSTELTTPTIAAESTTTVAERGSSTTEAPGTTRTFMIDATRSRVSFGIDEELRGSPAHVEGETDQVAGQVLIDVSDLSTAQFSPIVVNARTFRTDAERRDRAIRGPIILNSASDEHEFITFDVSSIEGLAGAALPGQTVLFEVTGNLTIRGNTNPVTFNVRVTMMDENTIEGTADATVLRSDFGIGIPSVPGVANVGDEVILNLEFVAVSS